MSLALEIEETCVTPEEWEELGESFDSGVSERIEGRPHEVCQEVANKPLGYRIAKRFFDVVFSLAAIMVGLVPGLILSILIAIDTKGSPIYSQDRVGQKGVFRIYKFRTMVADSDDVEKYLSAEQLFQWHRERKVDGDPRITSLGRFLRKTSLDETANFINVLKGDMSVVGPRAITQDELEQHFSPEEQRELLSVPCGITGWWQVNERNGADFESGRRQAIEMEYVRNASLATDAWVFAKTFVVMFGKERSGK
ncbi:sugar transferase [Adlercreutzia sp. ZJ141]|uniref:sugar transferase n=1 Tax=Adlercreutzia sp. ZJ141 TaxID=2709406 RepID=UPI0013ECE9DA|nr:sugar transferase [Adlercreutzia sp. ZJ141]